MKHGDYRFFPLPPESYFLPIIVRYVLFFLAHRLFFSVACLGVGLAFVVLTIASAFDLLEIGKRHLFCLKIWVLLVIYSPIIWAIMAHAKP